ncbi:MAG TPA: hypothetical protein VIM16_15110 [Mucilaginibacter sp.]|jgi:micrococcal nuclease
MKKLLILTACTLLFACKAPAQPTVAVKNAAKHIGETVKVCDKVFSGKLETASQNTLLVMGSDDPNKALTVMIPAADRAKFKGKPEVDYRGKDVTVTGKLVAYKGRPEIVITDPKQLKVVLIDNTLKPAIDIKEPVH